MHQPPVFLSEDEARQAGALGREPVPDARYLLAPISVPPKPKPYDDYYSLEGFNNLSRLAVIVKPPNGQAAFTREDAQFAWAVWGAWEVKNEIGSPGILMKINNERDESANAWAGLNYDQKAFGLRLDWELGSVLTGSVSETARELTQYVNEAARRVAPRHWELVLNQTTEEAAQRAEQLIKIKSRFSKSVEMRIIPQNRPFFSQDVWRTAYALGMQWTNFFPYERIASRRWDRFIWPICDVGETLFSVSADEAHGVLTTESAARNETVPGLTFWYELPTAPAPLETFDRMALALNYFAQTLNGKAVGGRGEDLDSDRLETYRDGLKAAISEMAQLGIAPGSPEAARIF